jgi:hypothetical protein
VGLERGPLSLVSTAEELLGRKSNGFGLENRDYSRTTQKFAVISPTNGGRSVGILHLRTKATELLLCFLKSDKESCSGVKNMCM